MVNARSAPSVTPRSDILSGVLHQVEPAWEPLAGLHPSPTMPVMIGFGVSADSHRDLRSDWPTAAIRYADA